MVAVQQSSSSKSTTESWLTPCPIPLRTDPNTHRPPPARVVGATMMWSLSGRLRKKYKVEGDVRDALYKVCVHERRGGTCLLSALLLPHSLAHARTHAHPPPPPLPPPQDANEWVDALGPRRFMGGDAPNLADLAVFGVCRSVVGTDTFNDLMMHTRIGGWYERMFDAVGTSSRLS